MGVIVGVSPYRCCVEAKKLRDPQGISSSSIVVLIAGHIHIGLDWRSRGVILEIKVAIEVYYVKSIEIKVMTQYFNWGT